MKYYLVAGEASGDLHGSNLMAAIKNKDDNAQFRYWGGDLMQQQGGELVKHYRDTAIMGFLQVLLKIRTIKKNIDSCRTDMLSFKPDVLILIDYPGFNLKIAETAKKAGIAVHYYIAPKVWASREKRVEKIRACVDQLFTIFPFETAYFKKHHIEVNYVGNPLLDEIENKKASIISLDKLRAKYNLTGKPIITLLAGSRRQEIKFTLPIMLKAASKFKGHQVIIGGAPSIPEAFYQTFIQHYDVKLIYNETYSILKHADAAAVTSGTATLETALIGTPQVVCYKMTGGKIFFNLLRKFVKTHCVSLVNIIADHLAVKELLMHFLTAENLQRELNWLIFNRTYRQRIINAYDDIKNQLGGVGASERAAYKMIEYLEQNK